MDDPQARLGQIVRKHGAVRAMRKKAVAENVEIAEEYAKSVVRPALTEIARWTNDHEGHKAKVLPEVNVDPGRPPGPEQTQPWTKQLPNQRGHAVVVMVTIPDEPPFHYVLRCRVAWDGGLRVERACGSGKDVSWDGAASSFAEADNADGEIARVDKRVIQRDFTDQIDIYLAKLGAPPNEGGLHSA